MVKIIQQLASQNVINKRTSGTGNTCRYITIHETANESKGATAQAHANLQSNLNPRQASWQYQVDKDNIIQSFNDNVKCWAGGDGARGTSSLESIHIEICVNSDFKKAVANAVDLVKHLMKKHNIPLSNVVQHNKWSGKDCPKHLRKNDWGVSWSGLIALAGDKEVIQVSKPKPAPSKPTVSKPDVKPTAKPSGNLGLVDWMKVNKMDSSYGNREKLYGSGYKGTGPQNTALLSKLQNKAVSKPMPKPKPVAKKKTVTLPKSAKTWRTYKLNVQPVKANSDWSLTPSAFGGITYEILGRPQADVVTVNTSRGKRNIFVGPGTGAVIK